jgi:hypothetical protein
MLLLLGDSNYRNTMETFGEAFTSQIGEEVKFFMTSSNESLRLQLTNRPDQPKIVVIGAPVNEIVHKYNENKKKGRAETIREVLEEQNKIVTEAALANTQTVFLLVPPFIRNDPPWIKERNALGIFYVRDFVGDNGPWNLIVANSVKIVDEDISSDNVHLNHTGKEKLFKSLVCDILVCKENLGEGSAKADWASQIETSTAPTPSTLSIRKRPRDMEVDTEEEESESITEPKKGRFETVLDKIDMLVKEIKQERSNAKEEIQEINDKIMASSKEVEAAKVSIASLEKNVGEDNLLFAEVREDLDSLENENLKHTIIIRKLKHANVPKEKKELRAFVQTQARELVKKLLDDKSAGDVKYGAPLYNYIDPTKKENKEGYIPPFKVGFSCKDTAIRFRDAALKKAKEEGSEYKETYFTFFQSFGTKVRSILMWGLCDAMKTKEKEMWVTQQAAKPVLQIKENGRITKSLSFVKAMTEFKDKIPEKTIEEATKVAKKHFFGKLEKTFIVLKD